MPETATTSTLHLDSRPSSNGLEGVIAASTRLSRVDGAAGRLTLAGFAVEELAPRASFEEVTYLLWTDRLPTSTELQQLRADLAHRRCLPAATLAWLRHAAAAKVAPMDALRTAAATVCAETADISDPRDQARTLLAVLPVALATYERLRRGGRSGEDAAPSQAEIEALGDADLATGFLTLLDGPPSTRSIRPPRPQRVRALTTYLNTVADHGLNASTFTARVIVATGSDMVSAVTGAIGALKGPLHGGAPGPALDDLLAISAGASASTGSSTGDGDTAAYAETYLRAKLARGERLMGFGHRVYRVRDPRAEVLNAAAEAWLSSAGGDRELLRLAREVESTALRLLSEHKPDRKLHTNVEFYTALLLHSLGLPSDLFAPVFALGRTAGWIAHALEQLEYGRLIRPSATYIGEEGRSWQPLGSRTA